MPDNRYGEARPEPEELDDRLERVCITIYRRDLAILDELAVRSQRTRSDLIRTAVRSHWTAFR